MTSPVVHLGALPQDIARMIVRIIGVDHRPFLRKGPGIAFRLKVREESSHRTEKATLENKRLISPTWNDAVLWYLNLPQNLPPLERLYLYNGPPHEKCVEYGAQDDEMRKMHQDSDKHVQMYSVIPKHCAGRVGVDKWLDVYRDFKDFQTLGDSRAIEVFSNPQCIEEEPFSYTSWHFRTRRSKIDHFERFLASFSHIVHLTLDGFSNRSVFEKITDLLISSAIYSMELRVAEFDEEKQNSIFKLAQKCKSRRVSIFASRCHQASIGNFLAQLAHLGATVNLYEAVIDQNAYDKVRSYFHRPLVFWTRMSAELALQGVQVSVSSIRDAGFFYDLERPDARTHIAAKLVGHAPFHSDAVRPRGFYRDEGMAPYKRRIPDRVAHMTFDD